MHWTFPANSPPASVANRRADVRALLPVGQAARAAPAQPSLSGPRAVLVAVAAREALKIVQQAKFHKDVVALLRCGLRLAQCCRESAPTLR